MPRHSRAEAPSTSISVPLSPVERGRVREAAKVNGLSLSQFGRDALMEAAEECLEEQASVGLALGVRYASRDAADT